MKKTIIITAILVLAVFIAFRITQIISGKTKIESKGQIISPATLVEVALVIQGLMEDKISRTGDIVPSAQVTVYSKGQGWLEKIYVREGDRVKTGEILATLNSREAEAAVAQSKASLEATMARLKQVEATSQQTVQTHMLQTKANLEQAEADLKRARELHDKNFISRQQLEEAQTKYNVAKASFDLDQYSMEKKTWENDIALAEAQMRQAKANLDLSQAQLSNLTIRSPMDGQITKRFVDPGAMIKDATSILILMDLNQVKRWRRSSIGNLSVCKRDNR